MYNFKMTPQRLAIIEYLKNNKEHPSALDVFKAISNRFPTISFATVYNTLEMLKNKGFIVELTVDPERKRFDPDLTPHHHMVCTKCGKVEDLFVDFSINIPENVKKSFEIERIHLDIYGTCGSCKKA
ncbi:MAG: transcriptional repressor [Deltaproteobacteria bacterium]|nr:transcriptional repressor [Deltaproteobacteria bacterium]